MGYLPSMSSETHAPDALLAGGEHQTKKITILSGEGELDRGTLMGRCYKGAMPTTGTADGGNTGNGTMTSVSAGVKAKIGTYEVECIAAPGGTPTVPTEGTKTGTGNGTMTGVSAGADVQAGDYVMTCINADVSGSEVFKVVDPDGNRLDDATVGVAYTSSQINFTINDGLTDFIVGDYFTVTATAVDGDSGTFKVKDPDGYRLDDATVGSAYTSSQINFTINDGATDYAVGDKFTIALAAGALDDDDRYKYRKAVATNVDGSADPELILGDDTDATSADAASFAYVSGRIKTSEITLDASLDIEEVEPALAGRGIYLK